MKCPSVGRDTLKSCTKCEFLCHVVGLGGVKSILHSKGECVDCSLYSALSPQAVQSSELGRSSLLAATVTLTTHYKALILVCFHPPAGNPSCVATKPLHLLSICSYADLILRAATFMHRRCKSKYVERMQAYECQSEARDLLLC